MKLSKVAYLFSSLMMLGSVAQGELRVRECSYNIHQVHVSDIRQDSYFENPLEMRRVGANRFVGSKELSYGYRLKVNAVIENGKIAIHSEIYDGFRVPVLLKGAAALSARTFLLRTQNENSALVIDAADAAKPITVFNLVEIRCLVAQTQMSDRLADLLY